MALLEVDRRKNPWGGLRPVGNSGEPGLGTEHGLLNLEFPPHGGFLPTKCLKLLVFVVCAIGCVWCVCHYTRPRPHVCGVCNWVEARAQAAEWHVRRPSGQNPRGQPQPQRSKNPACFFLEKKIPKKTGLNRRSTHGWTHGPKP